MSRYQPTDAEQAAIDLLRLAGYAVLRERSHAALVERVRVAEALRSMETEWRASTDAWARRECDEQRRLQARSSDVVAAAAAQGVSIDAISRALHPTAGEADQ